MRNLGLVSRRWHSDNQWIRRLIRIKHRSESFSTLDLPETYFWPAIVYLEISNLHTLGSIQFTTEKLKYTDSQGIFVTCILCSDVV